MKNRQNRVDYQTIKGKKQHEPSDQVVVDRAARVLYKQFGDETHPELTRELLSKPQNVLVASDSALCIILRADEKVPTAWRMWVEPTARGKGLGSALFAHVVEKYASDRHMKLDCSIELVGFYERHGFHVRLTAQAGRYAYMAGPAETPDEVQYLLPRSLRQV